MRNDLNHIDQILKKEIEQDRTPSLVYYLFNQDSVIKKVELGYADLFKKIKADENTFYKAFSATKTFTSVAILQLAEQGKLNLDDAVIKHLPDFMYGEKITIRQLLSHSAGIPNPIPLSWIHSVEDHDTFNRDQFFQPIFKKNPKAKYLPNERFMYSNLGYFILGQLIEKASGLQYETYIERNILFPLDLDTTLASFKINSQHAIGYHSKYSFSNLFLGWFVDKKFMLRSIGKWKPFIYFYPNGAAYGGLMGTPKAFVIYLQDLLKGNSLILSSNAKEQMLAENKNKQEKPTGMCLGWFTDSLNGVRYVAHPGGGGGYYCELRIYPDLGIGSVIFFNRTGMTNERFLDKLDAVFINSHKKQK